MVDIDAAIGFVVARGDAVDRARLSFLRTGSTPSEAIYNSIEGDQTRAGGWPAQGGDTLPSIDATCFRLAEMDDLGGLRRPAAKRALDWLAGRQRLDGTWEEDPALHDSAPPWAKPGDPEARLYLTANAAYTLTIPAPAPPWAKPGAPEARFSLPATAASPPPTAAADASPEALPPPPYEIVLSRAARAMLDALDDNGVWPGFLISGWLAAATLHRAEWFYESARIMVVLGDRVPTMSPADAAWMLAALRRAGVSVDDPLLAAARRRLDVTQRPDGAWPSDDGPAFEVHTTLTALRALR